jgi:hypothetical protein
MDQLHTSVLIALDVETISSKDSFEFSYNEPIPTYGMVPEHGSLKDPLKIEEYKQKKFSAMLDDYEKDKQKAREEAEKEWRQEGLCSYKGRIICMSYAKDSNWKNIKTIDFLGGEKEMLQEFYNDIKPYGVVNFLGSNVKYDLLFIFHRAMHFKLYDLANEVRMDRGYNKTKIVELMDLASGNIEWKYRISLDNICKLLGVKSPKGNGIDGSKVLDYYLEGRLEEIKEYNRADVSQLIECYQILK